MSLRAVGLGKQHGATAVFRHVDLRVEPGEFVAIVGESGVGKSTLLNCLAALEPWDQGQVWHRDTELGALDEAQRAHWRRAELGFVFQAFHVLPHLDVAQNIGLPLLLLRRPDPARIDELMARVGLQGLGERLPSQLSGGQLQRVAIARALVHRPAIVLADEPTGNLDPATAARVLDLLQAQTREQGSSLVLVTHAEAAARRADRLLRLTADGLVPGDPAA